LDDFISLFSRLPAAQRARIETRFLTTLAHGIHMLAYVAPSDNALRQLSSNAARVSGVAACDSYRIGDFARLAQAPMSDPNAAQKLNALADLVWRTAQFQRDPQLRQAMVDLVNRYCIMPPRCYHG
jgi:hypothetical protein